MTANDTSSKRVLLLGATGTIGRATLSALLEAGHDVVCLLRQNSSPDGMPEGVNFVRGDVTGAGVWDQIDLKNLGCDAIVSCMASRTGMPRDAWAIDHGAHLNVLTAAQDTGIEQFVLLSALCVQKPLLPFQQAKLAFETALIESGLTYSIVRPTAFFKSLSGQLQRLRDGKPFLVFGDGKLTACKSISDRDLGRYICACLAEPHQQNRILPIGGPGPAITPLQQGEKLFELLGQQPNFRHVPVRMMDAIIAGLSMAGFVSSSLRDKAELARIGRYYATQSMLVWDEASHAYSADATPETGQDTLFDFYEALVRGDETVDLGDHSVF